MIDLVDAFRRRPLVCVGLGGLAVAPLLVSSHLVFPYVTGPTFGYRLALGVVVLALAARTWSDRPHVPCHPLDVGVCGLVLASLVASLSSDRPLLSLLSTPERLDGTVGLLTLALTYGVFRVVPTVWRRGWLVVSLGVTLLVAGESILAGGSRLTGSFLGSPTFLASLLVVHVFAAAWLWIRGVPGWVVGGVMVVLLTALLGTGTRGALVGLGAGAVTVALCWPRGALPRGGLVGLVAVLAAVVILALSLGTGRGLARFGEPGQGRVRVELWQIALQAVLERPWTGWGHERFDVVVWRHFDPSLGLGIERFDRVHHEPLEWFVDGGLVLGGAWLLTWSLAIRSLRAREASHEAVLLGAVVAYLTTVAFAFRHLASAAILFVLLAEIACGSPTPWGAPAARVRLAGRVLASALGAALLALTVAQHGVVWALADRGESSDALHLLEARAPLAGGLVERRLLAEPLGTPKRDAWLDRRIAEWEARPGVYPRELVDAGVRSLRGGDPHRALHLFSLAAPYAARVPAVRMNLAYAHLAAGRPQEALAATHRIGVETAKYDAVTILAVLVELAADGEEDRVRALVEARARRRPAFLLDAGLIAALEGQGRHELLARMWREMAEQPDCVLFRDRLRRHLEERRPRPEIPPAPGATWRR